MFDDASKHLRKQDKKRRLWDIYLIEDDGMLSWYARSGSVGGRFETHVRTHDIVSPTLAQSPMAILEDVQVHEDMENRGVGSILVKVAIAECKTRGHRGITGLLSSQDAYNFDKLKYFYEKLGFSVTFFGADNTQSSSRWQGKVELVF